MDLSAAFEETVVAALPNTTALGKVMYIFGNILIIILAQFMEFYQFVLRKLDSTRRFFLFRLLHMLKNRASRSLS